MRPLYLEFKGLNSFSEKAQIDFTPLLSGGIFGIFGETGSGKSTILDAINFALFGKIGRSPLNTDIINDKCDSLEVKFTFDIFSEGIRKKYHIERVLKRTKSGSAQSTKLYDYTEGSQTFGACLTENVKKTDEKIVEIIGISEEDFKKCIALPQGEFSRFVKSAPSERTDLIERLFSLQKYGENLKCKLSRYSAKKDSEYNELKGKLSIYEGVTEEKLKELQAQAAQLKEKEEELKMQADKANALFTLLKKQLDDKNLYLAARAELDKLSSEKSFYDELGKILPVLPDCASAINYSNEITLLQRQIVSLKKEKKLLIKQSEALTDKRQQIADKFASSDYDGEYAKLNELYGKMSALLPDVERLVNKEEELTACRERYKQQQKVVASLALSVESKRNALDEAGAKLNAITEPDLLDYFGSQLKGGILKDEYGKSLCYIKDLLNNISFYADDSLLYEYIIKELNTKAEEYKQLILSVKDARIDVNAQLALFNKRLKAYRDAENAVKKFQSEYDIEFNNKVKAEEKVADILAEGERLKHEKEEIIYRLAAVFGEKTDYREQTIKTRQAADKLKLLKKENEELLKKTEEEIAGLNLKIAAAEQGVKSDEERITILQTKLTECINKAHVADIEGCRQYIAKYGDYVKALREYNKFISDYAAAEREVNRLRSAYNEDVTEQSLKTAEEEKLHREAEYGKATQSRAVIDSEINNFIASLNEKKTLDGDMLKLNAERDLITQLEKLLRDNRFMKYIADEHLQNICRTASATLIDLTDGRYFLCYKENYFHVGDNFNGGNLRHVNTLSGGETFLVSLSLALALSETICKRSLKSTEFFFLDEGFGTLDGDLIDTVIDALEKLKSADFTIGLISHVEELKHRINNKILVSKATESHGSSVKISC